MGAHLELRYIVTIVQLTTHSQEGVVKTILSRNYEETDAAAGKCHASQTAPPHSLEPRSESCPKPAPRAYPRTWML